MYPKPLGAIIADTDQNFAVTQDALLHRILCTLDAIRPHMAGTVLDGAPAKCKHVSHSICLPDARYLVLPVDDAKDTIQNLFMVKEALHQMSRHGRRGNTIGEGDVSSTPKINPGVTALQ